MDPTIGVNDALRDLRGPDAVDGISYILLRGDYDAESKQDDTGRGVMQPEHIVVDVDARYL